MKRLGFVSGISFLITLIFLNLLCSETVTFIVAITALIMLVISFLFIKSNKSIFIVIRIVAIIVLAASALFYSAYNINYKSNEKYFAKELNISGTVYEQPITYNEQSYSYIIKPNNKDIKGKILVHSKEKLEMNIYDEISMNIRVSNTKEKSLLDQSYNRAKGIYLTGGYLNSFNNNGLMEKLPFRYKLLSFKEHLKNTLSKYTNGPIATAIMTGDKTDITDSQNILFKKAGISHLMATSGFHLSLLSMILFLILNAFKLPYRVSIIFVMFVSVLFAAFVGFPPSMTRALIMLLIFYAGFLFYIEIDALNSLGVAATIICILNPFSAMDMGFLLSFVATLAILCVPEQFNIFNNKLKYKSKSKGKKFVATILGSAVVSIYAIIFTTPLIMLFFGGIPLYSLLCNIIGVLLAPLIVMLGILVVATSKFVAISTFFGSTLTFVLNIFIYILEKITTLPNSMFYGNYWFFYAISIALIIFLFLKRYSDMKIKFSIALAIIISVVICVTAVLFMNSFKANNGFYVKFIDVGQGDSALVSDGENLVMIDVGDTKTSKKVNSEIANTNAKFKTLLLSHFHIDHSGATMNVIDAKKPEKIIAPTSISNIAIINSIKVKCAANNVEYITAIDDITINEIKDTKIDYFVKHIKELEDDENNRSALVKIETSGKKFLFMGDYDMNYTHLINTYGNNLKADVLKVAHHGSKYTVTNNLISTINPLYAIISVGEDNKYGLPSSDTINLLKYTYKIPFYRTDYTGNITARIINDEIKIAS